MCLMYVQHILVWTRHISGATVLGSSVPDYTVMRVRTTLVSTISSRVRPVRETQGVFVE